MIHIFILNPKAGARNWTMQFRRHLESIPNLQYYVFSAGREVNETELVKRVLRIFKNDHIRLYACGGSGTMQRMLDGIDDFEKVEVAMYPVGYNEFLNVFGESKRHFGDIEKLIDGIPRRIDYIKTNHGIALNSFSVGMDACVINVQKTLKAYGFFSKKIAYMLGMLIATFSSNRGRYSIQIGERYLNQSSGQIVFMNGNRIGNAMEFSENTNITDGLSYYGIYPMLNFFGRVRVINLVKKKDYKALASMCEQGLALSMHLRSERGMAIKANLDGEIKVETDWRIEVVHKGLSFVLPKEVSL